MRRVGLCGIPLLLMGAGCSSADDTERIAAASRQEGQLHESQVARAILARARETAAGAARQRAPHALLTAVVVPRPSEALGFDGKRDDGLLPIFRGGSQLARPARVVLPAHASAPFHLTDVESGLSISVSLEGTRSSSFAALADGVLVYPMALDDSSAMLHRPTPIGTEDFIWYRAEPPAPVVRYDVELGERVAGLRLVERTLEFVDRAGAPRLRVAPPFLLSASGQRVSADVTVVGCVVDTSSVAPWGRPAIDPGARHCRYEVRWSDIDYPALLDPVWSSTGSMASARYSHTLDAIDAHTALVAGGTDGASGLASAELYDLQTGTWAATASLATPRYHHASARLLDGRVVVSGGHLSVPSQSLATAEIYNSATGGWSAAGSMSGPRELHRSTVLQDGRVLVSGGRDVGLAANLATCALYDPTSNAWSDVGSLSDKRSEHTSTRLTDGRVLVAGGSGSGTLTTAELYDPGAQSWTSTGALAEPRFGHTADLLASGKVLVVGGFGFEYLASAERFDPAAGTWTMAEPIAGPRRYHVSALLPSGALFLAGGEDANFNLASGSIYDSSAAAWKPISAMPKPLTGAAAVAFDTGQALVVGGSSNTGSSAEAFLFTPDPIGAPCSIEGNCASLRCVDGVCCDKSCEGLCEACAASLKGRGADGACGPIASGSDPEAECKDSGSPACGENGHCDGRGACALYSERSGCSPEACTRGDDCASGFCVDGICCDAACSGICETCLHAKGASQDGHCQPTPAGVDPDDDCADDGSGDCASVALCDGASGCADSSVVCAPYVCSDASHCATSCASDDGCSPGARCDDEGACVDETPTCEDHVATAPDGTRVDCAPYKCDADGSCKQSCGSVDDCAAPNVCGTDGRCIAPGAASGGEEDGCGCRLAGQPRAAAWLALGLFGALRRLRRSRWRDRQRSVRRR